MALLGLDIGGANLKAADGLGRAAQVPFPLWKSPERLEAEIRSLARDFPAVDRVALTMTGELCDCFATKSDGVRHIVASVAAAAPQAAIDVWTTAGNFRSPHAVADDPLPAAAANWLALATYAGRYAPRGNAMLIDLGSTTCDVVPLFDGRPIPTARTDPERLASEELTYCGVRRTPLCAVLGLDAAAEWFAVAADAFVVLGDLPEDPADLGTPDGRPLTRANARARLARMQCDEGWSDDRAAEFAVHVRDAIATRLARSVDAVAGRMPGPVDAAILSGAGEFLLPRVLAQTGVATAARISLARRLGPAVSVAACANAVAVLAGEAS